MANTGGLTWDMGVMPYQPGAYLWMERYESLVKAAKECGFSGLMESHHFGFYPSIISELANWNFTLDSNDGFIHLTNYSVQKYHDDFSKIEKGNEISYKQFQEELNAKHNGIDFRKEIYPKICNIIKIAFNSVKDKINLLKRTNCFELFGCDFLIDEKYNPFLIEINTNPGLE